jgi:lysophospholipase L1-like esterase
MDPLGLNTAASANPEHSIYDFILIGDSLIANWNPSGYKILNLGIPSQTSAQVLHRMQIFDTDISAERIIICAGGNDLKILRVLPENSEAIAENTLQNIKEIISAVKNKSSKIYILTIPPIYKVPFYLTPFKSTKALLSSLDAINMRLKTELSGNNITVIDVEKIISPLERTEVYASDGIHLSQKAYDKILNAITKDN